MARRRSKRRGSLRVVIGGNSSGKSDFAVGLLAEVGDVVVVATGRPSDREMQNKIDRHKRRRPSDWDTLECGGDLVRALEKLVTLHPGAVLVESLGGWVAGYARRRRVVFEDALRALESSLGRLLEGGTDVVIVCELAGLGGVPANRLQRRFEEYLGEATKRLAESSAEVWMVVAGIGIAIAKPR